MKPKRTLLTSMVLCASLLILASPPVMAQSDRACQAQSNARSNSPKGVTCGAGKTFTFSAGAHLFSFCLQNGGNIKDLVSPAGFKHIVIEEGYVACGTGAASAFSHGGGESGWEPATTTSQPGGANTLPVTIVRQTTDGKFQLTQTFDWNTLEKEILITMVLKNISAGSISNVRLSRYFHGIISNDVSDDIYDRDSNSVWGIDDGAGTTHHGLMLTALTFTQTHTAFVEKFDDWFDLGGGAQTAKTCTAVAQPVPAHPCNYVGRLTYALGTLTAGASKTVQVVYRRF